MASFSSRGRVKKDLDWDRTPSISHCGTLKKTERNLFIKNARKSGREAAPMARDVEKANLAAGLVQLLRDSELIPVKRRTIQGWSS